jgi:2-methylcitrate dehydratase PrpD
MTVCADMAAWAAELELGDVPERVRERARLQTLSILAAGKAGADEAAPFARHAPDGLPGEVYSGAAASIAHDWDDYLFMGHTGHSSVWAARTATGDPERALVAQIAGNELAGRLGAALFLGPHNGQFWASIHCLGAAAAAGVGLGLDPDQLANALAIALYQPPYGLWPGFMGPPTKLLTAAEPAAQGVRAALLAADGVTGPLDVIEHRRGLLTHFAFVRRPVMLGALGAVWLTDTLAFKPRPGCAYLQAAVDAVLQAGVSPDEVASVRVRAGYLTATMEKLAPSQLGTPASVNFSTARSVAVALIAGRLTHEELAPDWLAARREQVESLASRVSVQHDWPLTVEMLRGTLAAGGSAGDVPTRAWRTVLGRLKQTGMSDVALQARDLVELLGQPRLLADIARLVASTRRRDGIAALDTDKLRLAFPSTVRIELTSGRMLELAGDERGACGRPLTEQRQVIDDKCQLVGLEAAVAAGAT